MPRREGRSLPRRNFLLRALHCPGAEAWPVGICVRAPTPPGAAVPFHPKVRQSVCQSDDAQLAPRWRWRGPGSGGDPCASLARRSAMTRPSSLMWTAPEVASAICSAGACSVAPRWVPSVPSEALWQLDRLKLFDIPAHMWTAPDVASAYMTAQLQHGIECLSCRTNRSSKSASAGSVGIASAHCCGRLRRSAGWQYRNDCRRLRTHCEPVSSDGR